MLWGDPAVTAVTAVTGWFLENQRVAVTAVTPVLHQPAFLRDVIVGKPCALIGQVTSDTRTVSPPSFRGKGLNVSFRPKPVFFLQGEYKDSKGEL